MFFHFHQNNSGGSFDYDEEAGITAHVIVEADSSDDANRRAKEIGIYFHGIGDCPCCGDRWYEQWYDDDGTENPQVYGKHPDDEDILRWMEKGRNVVVHFKSGKKEWY